MFILTFFAGLFVGIILTMFVGARIATMICRDEEQNPTQKIYDRYRRQVFVNEYEDGVLGHVAWQYKGIGEGFNIDGVKPVRQVQFVEVTHGS